MDLHDWYARLTPGSVLSTLDEHRWPEVVGRFVVHNTLHILLSSSLYVDFLEDEITSAAVG